MAFLTKEQSLILEWKSDVEILIQKSFGDKKAVDGLPFNEWKMKLLFFRKKRERKSWLLPVLLQYFVLSFISFYELALSVKLKNFLWNFQKWQLFCTFTTPLIRLRHFLEPLCKLRYLWGLNPILCKYSAANNALFQ